MCRTSRLLRSLVVTLCLSGVAALSGHSLALAAGSREGMGPNGCSSKRVGPPTNIVYNGTTVGQVILYQDTCSLRLHGHTSSYVGNANLYADIRDSAGGPVSNTGFGTGLDSPEVPNGSNAEACGYVEYQGSHPSGCAT
jgi:hypothetical protein